MTIEKPKESRPYETQPEENVYCETRGCYSSTVEDKNRCTYHACPYSNNGDDGYF